jgi:hypothetical protein
LVGLGFGFVQLFFWELVCAMVNGVHTDDSLLIGHEKPGGVQNQYEQLADGIFNSLVHRGLTVEHMADVMNALGKQLVIYAEMQDALLKAQLKDSGALKIRGAVMDVAAGHTKVGKE